MRLHASSENGLFEGFIPTGGDISSATLTVEEAIATAEKIKGCRGFTFKGKPTGEPVQVFFKDKYQLKEGGNELWTSYKTKAQKRSDFFQGLLGGGGGKGGGGSGGGSGGGGGGSGSGGSSSNEPEGLDLIGRLASLAFIAVVLLGFGLALAPFASVFALIFHKLKGSNRKQVRRPTPPKKSPPKKTASKQVAWKSKPGSKSGSNPVVGMLVLVVLAGVAITNLGEVIGDQGADGKPRKPVGSTSAPKVVSGKFPAHSSPAPARPAPAPAPSAPPSLVTSSESTEVWAKPAAVEKPPAPAPATAFAFVGALETQRVAGAPPTATSINQGQQSLSFRLLMFMVLPPFVLMACIRCAGYVLRTTGKSGAQHFNIADTPRGSANC